ncbi:MAG TPA: hypothetical protein VFS21_27600 [Roseiflexaceae bacterium]|nr:hypothetical protein [Roseiflexaceae bacterium]
MQGGPAGGHHSAPTPVQHAGVARAAAVGERWNRATRPAGVAAAQARDQAMRVHGCGAGAGGVAPWALPAAPGMRAFSGVSLPAGAPPHQGQDLALPTPAP